MKKFVVCGAAVITGILGGILTGSHIKDKIVRKAVDDAEKYQKYFHLSNQWLTLKNEGKQIEQYFVKHHFSNIAIYGMADLGQRLWEELEDSSISVLYGVDQRAAFLCADYPLYKPEQSLPDADAVVVTSVYYFNDIFTELTQKKKISCPVISLEDVIYELL